MLFLWCDNLAWFDNHGVLWLLLYGQTTATASTATPSINTFLLLLYMYDGWYTLSEHRDDEGNLLLGGNDDDAGDSGATK